ncbi:MAG: pseudouridine synthase [Nitrospinae bacterium]|nr:pseudouridine synthase [Nitrospinota bacterium]
MSARQTDKDKPAAPKLERLHKIIARAGAASLREAERLILEGEVSVNGRVVAEKGATADPQNDTIRVSGRIIPKQDEVIPVYLMAYKPKGLVTTRSDDKGRRTVMELLPKKHQNLYPVGRLDTMSEGLLIFTNDGNFAQALLAPKNEVPRVYMVKVRNVPDERVLKKAVSGITVEGEKLKAAEVKIVEVRPTGCWLRVTLLEGKNRHIRRLFEPLGHPVVKLKRIAIGPLTLGNLEPGELRHLSGDQISGLKKATGHGWRKEGKRPSAKPSLKAPTNTPRPASRTSAKPSAKPAPRPASWTSANPSAKPATRPATWTSAKPSAKPATRPAARPAGKPTGKRTSGKKR